MTSHERAKYQERQEPAGDRVAERPEVLGHGQTGQVAGEGEPDLVARDDLAEPGHPSPASAATTDEGSGDEAEVQGHHLGSNPTLMKMHVDAKHRDLHAESKRLPTGNQAAAGNQSLVERVKEKFRGSTG